MSGQSQLTTRHMHKAMEVLGGYYVNICFFPVKTTISVDISFADLTHKCIPYISMYVKS
jgi:hypothetical protein